MFDWDGEELGNIIWGKAGDHEDHIVPYPDETYEKPPKPDLSPSNATKLDLEHTDKKAQVNNVFQNFDDRPDDKDAISLINYGWANVGSFDDFDRILSNNDLGYENVNISSIEDDSRTHHLCYSTGGVNTNVKKVECSGGINEKIGEQRKSLKSENTKGQKHDPWFCVSNQGKEFKRRYAQHLKTSSSKVRSQEHLVPSPCGYNIIGNQQFNSCEEQSSPCGSSSLMPVSMTPQEKIEKLRRRHQMRALLAIRKQQEREFRQIDESLSGFMSLEKSDLDTRPMMMNASSLEDTILHQLQNVIATLDIKIRLCIRDSLFRLAQSAFQRQYAGETVNVVTSSARNGETKTNPIDRAVAHLLFNRPPELSAKLL